MKKLIFNFLHITALVVLMLGVCNNHAFSQAQKHVLMLEKITGGWCPHCTLAMPVFDNLREKYPESIVLASYSSANGETRSTAAGDKFIAKAGFGGYPTMQISRITFSDGKGGSVRALGFSSNTDGTTSNFASTIDQILNNEPNAKINVEIDNYNYDPASKKVSATITCRFNVDMPTQVKLNLSNGGTATGPMGYYLSAIPIEDKLIYDQADAHNIPNNNIHNEVVRGMYPNENGMQLVIPAKQIVNNMVLAGTVITSNINFTSLVTVPANGKTIFCIADNFTYNNVINYNTIIQDQQVDLTSKVSPAYELIANETTRNVEANTEQNFVFTMKNLQTVPVTVSVKPTEMTFPTAPGWSAKLSFGSTYNDLSTGQALTKPLQPNETATCTLKVMVGNTPASKGTITLDYSSPQGNPTISKQFVINVNAAPPAFEFSNGPTEKSTKPTEVVEYTATVKNLKTSPISVNLKVLSVQKPSTLWKTELCINGNCNDAADGQKITKTIPPGESLVYTVKVTSGSVKGEKSLVKLNVSSPDGDPDKDVIFTTTAMGPAFTLSTPVIKKAVNAGDNAIFDATLTNNYSSKTNLKISATKVTLPSGWKIAVGTDGFFEPIKEGDKVDQILNDNEQIKFGIKVTTSKAGDEVGSITLKFETADGFVSYEETFKVASNQGGSGVSFEPVIAGGVTFNQNFPNPASLKTNFEVVLPSSLNTSLTVFSQDGKSLITLNQGKLSEGKHIIEVNVENLPSGNYNVMLRSGDQTLYRQMNVVR
jgi:thiol-disulfide isomerase/thioredoxin